MNKPVVVVAEPQYKRGLKRLYAMHKYSAVDTLENVIDLLSKQQILPPKYKPHKLKGVNQWECHIQSNILLTWRYEEDMLVINLRLLDLTDHDKLGRKSKIHGGLIMKRILGNQRTITNKRYRKIQGAEGEYIMTPEEEEDWNRRWDEKFSKYDNVPLSLEEFRRIRKEMHEFE